ncbi:MAG: prepilin-type N-terminal cleavage/methylation domain-containing protein [Synergistaceae bacterium]|jgi:prepilin-type N-terminal cleavage/methylation domain-containing protein|nr:prepilin-type N-terminal cleavage/methylation domain-containing protein [Synergistaceae bacterium]
MAPNKFSAKKGFTLVELLLVIVLMAIIMTLVTLSGSDMISSTNAQTEARRLIRGVQLLRSAWLSCYADSQVQIGITPTAKSVADQINAYSDGSLTDETLRYGNIAVTSNDTGLIHIGFSGPWNIPNMNRDTMNTMIEVIGNQAGDYDISFDKTPLAANAAPSKRVFIRVR